MIAKTTYIKARNSTTFARAGRLYSRDCTKILTSLTFFTLRRGLKTLIVLKAVKLVIPGMKLNHPVATTMKSSMFQESYRYVFFPRKNPMPITFTIHSNVKRTKKTSSLSSMI